MSKDPEILSATYGDEGFIVKLKTDAFENPAYWGMALADIAVHCSHAYEKLGKGKSGEILKEIVSLFIAEIERPTDIAEGEFEN